MGFGHTTPLLPFLRYDACSVLRVYECVCNTQPVRCVMCKILFSKIIVVGVDYVSNFKVNILRFCLDLDVLKVENS